MDRPAKRRRLLQSAHASQEGDGRSGDNIQALNPAASNQDAIDQPFLQAAIAERSTVSLTATRTTPLLPFDHEQPNTHRLHPRDVIPYQAGPNALKPVVQPVQTAVASFVNVVLESGGASVGNVLVPAESTVFNLNGYGPITIDKNPPHRPTPSSGQQNPPPALHTHHHSHATQPTPQPAPMPVPQPAPSVAASQGSPPQQSPMSIEVPGSSSQVILSSPPTPLPPSPSNSTSTATGNESYFSSTSSQTSSSSQTLGVSSTSSPAAVTTSQSPQTSKPGSTPSAGNFSTSAITSSEIISGTTRLTTIPVIVTPTANSTSLTSPTPFGSLLTSSNSLIQSSITSSNSTFATSTRSPSSTFSSSSTILSSSSSSASASSSSFGSGVPGGAGGSTGTAGSLPAASTTAAAASGDDNSPSTPTLVGSVVGGVAGLTLILVLLLFFLRRRKKLGQQRTISPPVPQSASTGPGANIGTMTERSSAAVPLTGAGFLRRLRPGSGATATTTETTPSERGFQNLGGRKLESVLSSRGDGFGDIPFGAAGTGAVPGPSSSRGPPPAPIPIVTAAPGAAPGHSSPESLSGSSFYRDSQGFYGGPAQSQQGPDPPSNSSSMFVGPGSPPQSPTHPPPGTSQPSQEGVAVTRPGPARTPVITQPGGLSPLRGSPRQQQRGTPPPPHIPGTIPERVRDGLGRSHPSMDGSRSSRFAEDI